MRTTNTAPRYSHGPLAFALCIAAATLFAPASGPTSAAQENDHAKNLLRNRVISIRQIPAEQAMQFLQKLEIGDTISTIPAANALVVSGRAAELVKAGAVCKLIDTKETTFKVKVLADKPAPPDWPANDVIAAATGKLKIADFQDPPLGSGPWAIIDVHQDRIIAIAPAELIDRLAAIVDNLRQAAPAAATAEPNRPLVRISKKPEPSSEIMPAAPEEPNETRRVATEPALPEARPAAEEAKPVATIPQEPNETEEKPDELYDALLDSLMTQQRRAEAEQETVQGEIPATRPEELPTPGEPETEAPSAEQIVPEPEPQKTTEEPEQAQPPEEPPAPEPPKVGPAKIPPPEEPAEALPVEPTPEPEPYEEPMRQPLTGWPDIPNGDDMLELDLPERIELLQLIDLVGKYLNIDYLYEEQRLRGQVINLKLQGPIRVRELYALLESVMKFKGLAMSRKGNLVTIKPVAEVSDIDPSFDDAVKPGDVVITRLFQLDNVDTATAKALLTSMKLGVEVTEVKETGTLIVTEYAYRMDRITDLLAVIDVPGEPKKFRAHQLEYTLAESLVPKIQSLAEQLETVSITVAAGAAGGPAAAEVTRRPGESLTSFRRREAAARARARTTPGPTTATSTTATGVYLDFDERTNRILMIGYLDEISVVEELIGALDVEQQDLRSIKEYEIQYVDVAEVVETMQTLGVIAGQPQRRGAARTPARPGKPEGAPPAPTPSPIAAEELAPGQEPQVAVLEATNSLLVNATTEQHGSIAMVIAYIDREPMQTSIPYVVYPLENQDPEDLAGVLEKLIQKTIQQAGEKDAKIQTKVPRREGEEDITIVPDPKTYSLIVYASKKNQQWIGSLIEALDEYRPQVLLDCTLVRIRKHDKFEFDLKAISAFPNLEETSDQISPLIDLSEFSRDRLIELQSIGGTGTGFYADKHINLLLTAIQEKDYGRILARPKLLVNDNEKGSITTQIETTIVSPKTEVVAAGDSIQSSPGVQLDTYSSDITLEIQPHISKGDQLRLQITLNRTDFEGLGETYSITVEGGTIAGPRPPDLVTSNVETVVTVPDGKTIILGGLEQIDERKGGSKVPILGDIPLVGGLFRDISNLDDESRLYVFVKAHILRPGVEGVISDVARVSEKNRAAFEKYEKEMQEYEDWPGIEPEPIDPANILEED